jgi:hypothetical protein
MDTWKTKRRKFWHQDTIISSRSVSWIQKNSIFFKNFCSLEVRVQVHSGMDLWWVITPVAKKKKVGPTRKSRRAMSVKKNKIQKMFQPPKFFNSIFFLLKPKTTNQAHHKLWIIQKFITLDYSTFHNTNSMKLTKNTLIKHYITIYEPFSVKHNHNSTLISFIIHTIHSFLIQ